MNENHLLRAAIEKLNASKPDGIVSLNAHLERDVARLRCDLANHIDNTRDFTRTDFLTVVATSTILTVLAIVALTLAGVIK